MSDKRRIAAHDTRALFLEHARTGMLQFGRFQVGGSQEFWPVAFHLSLLPSFPDVLAATAEALTPYLTLLSERDRLLTTYSTIALGAVVATLTGIPMLYPGGDVKSYTAAFAIEGAADVGHPTTLLTDVLLDGKPEAQIIARATQVGLPVQRVVAVLDAGRGGTETLRHEYKITNVHSLFSLSKGLAWLVEENVITSRLAESIRAWQK
jgi:orotate phosphoribosyltransferase